jgi:hypothetical protein
MNQFRIGRALGLSFKAFGRNFIPLMLLSAVLYVPIVFYALSGVSAMHSGGLEGLEAALNRVFIYPLYMLIAAQTIIAPMLTYKVIQDLGGNKVSMGTTFAYGVRGIIPAIIMAVVTNLLQMIPMGGILSSIIMCIWFVAAPAAVAEKLNPIAALSRSAHLTSGRRWGIWGMMFLVGLIQIGLMMAWVIPTFSSGDEGSMKTAMIGFVAILGIFYAFTNVVEAVSYVLLREDKDGVTHEELARVFE